MTEYGIDFILFEAGLTFDHAVNQSAAVAVLHKNVDVISRLYFYFLESNKVEASL
jgi:hypothetical protein